MKLSTLQLDQDINKTLKQLRKTMKPKPKEAEIDNGARAKGATMLPSGVPTKPRHRKFFRTESPTPGI